MEDLYLICGAEAVPAAVRVLGTVPRGRVLVQLRARELGGRALLELARVLGAAARAAGARFLVNDRVDVALAADADGVHLPAQGLPVAAARALLDRRPRCVIGVSTHSAAEALRAAEDGADLVVLGPIWDTPGKGPPIGCAPLREVRQALVARGLKTRLYALGGVDVSRVHAAHTAGAHGVAVIRAVLAAADPPRAALELLAHGDG